MAEAKSKILVVEDELDVAEMLNAYFRVQGYEVYTVNWGEDGVRSCQTVHPDSDAVLRAFSLMIVNTLRELGNGDDFLGHIGPADFVMTVVPTNLSALFEHLHSRLDQSLDYFHPIKDRDQASKRKDRLAVRMSEMPLAAGGHIKSAEQLKVELLRRKN